MLKPKTPMAGMPHDPRAGRPRKPASGLAAVCSGPRKIEPPLPIRAAPAPVEIDIDFGIVSHHEHLRTRFGPAAAGLCEGCDRNDSTASDGIEEIVAVAVCGRVLASAAVARQLDCRLRNRFPEAGDAAANQLTPVGAFAVSGPPPG